MEIKITSVTAVNGGADVALGVRIDSGKNFETKRIVLLARRYASLGVEKGNIDEETLELLDNEGEICSAVKRGMYILGYGASSKKNLILKLRQKGFSRESAENAAEYLCELGYINEENDAVREAERCLSKYWGRRRIAAALYEKGYSDRAVQVAINSLDGIDFSKKCAEYILRKYKAIPRDSSEMKKLFSAMLRYGYSSSEIKEAITILS